MNSWLIVLLAIASLLVLLSRVNLYIDLHFCRRNKDDYLRITVHALQKLFIYSIKVPAIMIIKHNNVPWVASEFKAPLGETTTKVGREQRFLKKTAKLLFYSPDRFFRLLRLTKYIFRDYRQYMSRLSQGIHCEKLEFKTKYGFDDAAFTGIFMGVLGSVIQILLTTMQNRIIVDTRPAIKLQPNYELVQLELELSCIFRIRLGKVITATIEVLRTILRREATRSG